MSSPLAADPDGLLLPPPRQILRLALGWLVAALLLYGVSAAPDLLWSDPAKLTLYAVVGRFPSLSPGDHAGWTLLSWLALQTGVDAVAAAHRLSGVAGAVTVATLAALVQSRGGSRREAHTAAVLALVALPIWLASTQNQSYAPALAATLLGALAAGRRPEPGGEPHDRGWRRPLLAGLLWGGALAINAMSGFLILPLAWESFGKRAWRLAPGLLIGLAPVWLGLMQEAPDPIMGTELTATASLAWQLDSAFRLERLPRNALYLLALVLYAAGPLGLIAAWRGRWVSGGWVWKGSLGLFTLMLLFYTPTRLPLLVGIGIVGALCVRRCALPPRGIVGHLAAQTACYLLVPALLTWVGWGQIALRPLPGSTNAFTHLCPIKTFDRAAERYLERIEACLPPGAALLADFHLAAPLRLAQAARGWRPDLLVRPPIAVRVDVDRVPSSVLIETIRQLAAQRPVVLADRYPPHYRPDDLAAALDLESCGPTLRVRLRPGQPAPEATP